jgi:hypothetical protein
LRKEKRRQRKKMSMLEKLKEKASEAKEYISVTELPDEIDVRIATEPQFKVDKRGNECLFVVLDTKDGKRVVQKYTPSQYGQLVDMIERCGGIETLSTEYFTWKKKRIGRALNDRLFPQPKKQKEK